MPKDFSSTKKPGRQPSVHDINDYVNGTGSPVANAATSNGTVGQGANTNADQQPQDTNSETGLETVTHGDPTNIRTIQNPQDTNSEPGSDVPEVEQPDEPTKRLSLDIPASLHKRFKIACAATDTKMTDEVVRYIQKRSTALEKKSGIYQST